MQRPEPLNAHEISGHPYIHVLANLSSFAMCVCACVCVCVCVYLQTNFETYFESIKKICFNVAMRSKRELQASRNIWKVHCHLRAIFGVAKALKKPSGWTLHRLPRYLVNYHLSRYIYNSIDPMDQSLRI